MNYCVRITGPGVDHSVLIDTLDDLEVLDKIVAKMRGYLAYMGAKAYVEPVEESSPTFTGWIQKPCENCGKSSRDHIGLSMACPTAHETGAEHG